MEMSAPGWYFFEAGGWNLLDSVKKECGYYHTP